MANSVFTNLVVTTGDSAKTQTSIVEILDCPKEIELSATETLIVIVPNSNVRNAAAGELNFKAY